MPTRDGAQRPSSVTVTRAMSTNRSPSSLRDCPNVTWPNSCCQRGGLCVLRRRSGFLKVLPALTCDSHPRSQPAPLLLVTSVGVPGPLKLPVPRRLTGPPRFRPRPAALGGLGGASRNPRSSKVVPQIVPGDDARSVSGDSDRSGDSKGSPGKWDQKSRY